MDIDQPDITVSGYCSPNQTSVINTPIERAMRNLSRDFDPTSYAMSYPSHLFDPTTNHIPMQVNAPIEGATRNLSREFDPTNHTMSYPWYPFGHTTSQILMQATFGNNATRGGLYVVDPTIAQTSIACGEGSDNLLLNETI